MKRKRSWHCHLAAPQHENERDTSAAAFTDSGTEAFHWAIRISPMKRILHVVGGTCRGGIETWLLHVLRNIDRDRFAMDFFVHTPEEGSYDREIRELGSLIVRCPHFRHPWKYARQFLRCLSVNGPYDVVHTHGGSFSGWNMLLAMLAGVPLRIVHSHNDLRWLRRREGPLRSTYFTIMTPLVRRCSTVGLAASRQAAEDYYGMNWEVSGKFKIVYCGIELDTFSLAHDRDNVRNELGIPSDAFVIGHVGRFTAPKNHPFMFEILRETLKRDPRTLLVVVGDGLLESDARSVVTEMQIEDNVLFLGSRPDVPRLLLGCMDAFLFPSLSEGLGLAFIEAQAAGLPCVISDVIPPEADIVPPLVTRLSLSQPASIWADALLATRSARRIPQEEVLTAVAESQFNIVRSVKALEEIYEKATQREGAKW